MEKKLENDKEIVVVNNDNDNLLIKIKELEILKLRSNIANLFISLKTEEKKITLLKLKNSEIEKNISENEKQFIAANYKLHSNKEIKKEVKISELELKIKEKTYEIWQLEDQLSILLIVNAKNNKKILDFNINISELEKSSIEVKEKIKQIQNKSIEKSIPLPTEEDNVNINEKRSKKRWFRGIFKPIIKFIWGSKQKITMSYYQNKQKTLETEVGKLESKKLKNFWNKFWLIMSCGCYNNHGKMDRKIAEKKRKLNDVKKELEKLYKNNISNNEPQPSTSSALTNQDDAWSNKTKVEIEKTPLLKENSKNLSSTLT